MQITDIIKTTTQKQGGLADDSRAIAVVLCCVLQSQLKFKKRSEEKHNKAKLVKHF